MKGGIIFPNAEPFRISDKGVKEFAESIGLELSPHDLLVNLPRIPSQLIEGFFEGTVAFLLLWFVFRKIKKYDGFIFGVYIILYGFFRFLIEYLREPDKEIGFVITHSPPESLLDFSLLNISMGQVLSLILILSGTVWLSWAKMRSEKLNK